jgi:site-specific DNA recombinase
MKRAATYARKSATRSIERQQEHLRCHAARLGLDLVAEYVDLPLPVHGDLRPGFTALMEGARNQEFKWLLVQSFDRLGKSEQEVVALADELQRLGIALVSATEDVDPASAVGRLVLAIDGQAAAWERESTALGDDDSGDDGSDDDAGADLSEHRQRNCKPKKEGR